eukprot:jgi/Mesvir1/24271/Mv10971-RA.2
MAFRLLRDCHRLFNQPRVLRPATQGHWSSSTWSLLLQTNAGSVYSISLFSTVAGQARAGQPTYATHPEIVGPDELTPGIKVSEYAARRAALLERLPPKSAVLLTSQPAQYMSGIIPYPYRQDADFFYFTGLTQPACAMLLERGETTSAPAYTLFVPRPNEEKERWDGEPIRAEAAMDTFQASAVHYTDELPGMIRLKLVTVNALFCQVDRQGNPKASFLSGSAFQGKLANIATHSHELRWIKSPAEIAMMRKSAEIAGCAMRKCVQTCDYGMNEYEMAALFEYECKKNGAQRLSYPTVAASGSDTCTIHYSRNDKPIVGAKMFLMDAGCELHGYCSDITRVWPVKRAFTAQQREIYSCVLMAHSLCLSHLQPGVSLSDLHHLSVRVTAHCLLALGILKDVSVDDIVNRGLYRRFYPHYIGHWLGLDTHDVPYVPTARATVPGVVRD